MAKNKKGFFLTRWIKRAFMGSDQEVRDIMNRVLDEDYGNPSSMHKKGFQAEQYVTKARETIARSLKVSPKEIFFTSGGTEANNLALIGTALAGRRQRHDGGSGSGGERGGQFGSRAGSRR